MKGRYLALGAIGCAVWLAMAAEPVTVVAHHADLKPITAKAEVAEAVKGGCRAVEPRGAIFNDYVDYLAAKFENAAEFGLQYWVNFIIAFHCCSNKATAKKLLDDLRAGKNAFELMFNHEEEEEV